MSIGVLQLLLAVLQLLGPLLLSLQLPDVVDRRLQDGAFVPAHVPEKKHQAPVTPAVVSQLGDAGSEKARTVWLL